MWDGKIQNRLENKYEKLKQGNTDSKCMFSFFEILLKHRRRRTSDSYSFSAATATSRKILLLLKAQRGTPKSSSSFLAAVNYCPVDHFIVILT